ncbi:lecithin retinol acyltransferase family protein [Marinobacter sp. KM021]|mgnify:CR=1 FL=1|uniref:lecithin retinol acyltransferase family protein n=1 Tax=Marinobacter sp. KM021 TaxID=3075616 RepID=UPI003D6BD0AA
MQPQTNLIPGDVVKIPYPAFTHYGVISDRIGSDGKPMIIDNSNAAGTVSERTWSQVTRGKSVIKSSLKSQRPNTLVLAAAKQLIGQLKYSITGQNCEWFVRVVLGVAPTSQQVKASLITVPTAGLVAYRITRGNLLLTGLGCCLALAATTHAVSD